MPKRKVNPGLQIQLTPFSGILEIGKYKQPRKRLTNGDYPLLRNPFKVFLRSPPKNASIFLHTHPKLYSGFPSAPDLSQIVKDIQENKYRTGVISSTSFSGKEIGRVYIKTTPKTPKVPQSKKEWGDYEKYLKQRIDKRLTQSEQDRLIKLERQIQSATKLDIILKLPKIISEVSLIFSNALSRVYQLKIRIVPMKGYKYDKNNGRFVKK